MKTGAKKDQDCILQQLITTNFGLKSVHFAYMHMGGGTRKLVINRHIMMSVGQVNMTFWPGTFEDILQGITNNVSKTLHNSSITYLVQISEHNLSKTRQS